MKKRRKSTTPQTHTTQTHTSPPHPTPQNPTTTHNPKTRQPHKPNITKRTGGRERDAGRDDALDRRVVGEVEEQHGALEAAVLLKVLLEKVRGLHVDAHGGEDDRELVRLGAAISAGLDGVAVHVDEVAVGVGVLHEAGLAADLRGDVVVRQA